MQTTAPKKKKYLTNKDLKEELKKSHEVGFMTERLGKMFYLLVERLQRNSYYVDDNARQDCKQHAMLVLVENWHKFDMKYPNAFAYFTRTVMNGLYQGWNRNEKRPIHISLNAFINNDAEKGE